MKSELTVDEKLIDIYCEVTDLRKDVREIKDTIHNCLRNKYLSPAPAAKINLEQKVLRMIKNTPLIKRSILLQKSKIMLAQMGPLLERLVLDGSIVETIDNNTTGRAARCYSIATKQPEAAAATCL